MSNTSIPSLLSNWSRRIYDFMTQSDETEMVIMRVRDDSVDVPLIFHLNPSTELEKEEKR